MPLLNATYAAFAGVIVIIIIGIVVEKKKVVWENVFGNIMSFLLVIGTVDMSRLLLIGFAIYLLVGIGVAYYKVKQAYFLFGFKTYGSLSLVILLASFNSMGLSATANTVGNLVQIVTLWIVFTIIVHIIGFLYHKLK
jgi:hypothetical protein